MSAPTLPAPRVMRGAVRVFLNEPGVLDVPFPPARAFKERDEPDPTPRAVRRVLRPEVRQALGARSGAVDQVLDRPPESDGAGGAGARQGRRGGAAREAGDGLP